VKELLVIYHLPFLICHFDTTDFMSVVFQFLPNTMNPNPCALRAPEGSVWLYRGKLKNHRHEVGGFWQAVNSNDK
jgi:hypothetical protein